MDKKNWIIITLLLVMFFVIGLFYYQSQKQQEVMQQTLRQMQYNTVDKDGKTKDPYKEVAVNNALRKKVRDVQECYNRFVATNPQKTDGYVELDWIILPDGKVKKAELIGSDLNNETLNRCILEIVKGIEFAPPPTLTETYMTYKYNFKKAEDEKSEPAKVK